MNFTDFNKQLKEHVHTISLSPSDIEQRKELIEYIRSKVKNRNYEVNSDGANFYDTGLGVEVFGSYECGLSVKGSDVDLRVNDHYTYRYINLDTVSKNLTFVPYEIRVQRGISNWWTGPKSNTGSRLRVVEYFKKANF